MDIIMNAVINVTMIFGLIIGGGSVLLYFICKHFDKNKSKALDSEIYKKIEMEKDILKNGEFSVYFFPKEPKESDTCPSEYLLLSTYPPLVENPTNLFSSYGSRYKKKLEEIFLKNEFDVFIVKKNKIKKVNKINEILELSKSYDNSIIYC
ncbi:hypothetical protein [Clostridium neonatale]|uniref:hypothetical protein n=1 Tax=Clostridium neonatale TaxID=137838 RepID=UPI00291B844A|nr:hypothetical protein [Clostridium neonatale]CAI3207741.1 hypothetical protein CNEO2_360039 [Clostridium neonatale]